MKREFLIFGILLLLFSFIPGNNVSAAIEDGNYSVSYEVLRTEDNSASIADGYFVKPATLIVKDGKQHIQLTVTSSDMVKSLTGPYGKATILSENKAEKTKELKFQVENINNPISVKMHIEVDAGDIQYDTEHGARFKFSAPTATNTQAPTKAAEENKTIEKTANPKTADETNVLVFSLLLMGSSLIITRKLILNKRAS